MDGPPDSHMHGDDITDDSPESKAAANMLADALLSGEAAVAGFVIVQL